MHVISKSDAKHLLPLCFYHSFTLWRFLFNNNGTESYIIELALKDQCFFFKSVVLVIISSTFLKSIIPGNSQHFVIETVQSRTANIPKYLVLPELLLPDNSFSHGPCHGSTFLAFNRTFGTLSGWLTLPSLLACGVVTSMTYSFPAGTRPAMRALLPVAFCWNTTK